MSLQTYTGSDINVISAKLQTYLTERKLKPNEIVKYRLLGGVKNPDPAKAKGDEFLFPSSISIKLRHRIYDEDAGKDVEIGVVRSFDDITKRPVFAGYSVQPQKGDGGIFMIRASVISEREMYETLELSNDNASNPFRDQSDFPAFERVNEAAEGKVRSNKRNALIDSMMAIRQWDYDKMRIMAASYNLSTQLPFEVLKDMLEGIAEKSPQAFFDSIDSEELEVKAVIKMAKDAGVISFVAHENKWIFTASNELIILLDRKEGVTETDQFALFLKNGANGEKVKQNIQKLLAATKKKKKEDTV